MKPQQWHSALRSYVFTLAGLNFLWEIAQLPFYTLWQTATPTTIAFAVIHCTAGDVVIAITALVLCLVIFGNSDWPKAQSFLMSAWVVIAGLIYTIYSERMNIANGAWAYSDLMPIIPFLDVGLMPIFQWLLIPSYCLYKIKTR
jgi:hypothetical protein